MRLNDRRIALTLKLYLRLCAILAPSFLLISAIGLYFLTQYIVSSAEEKFSTRIGNAAARVSAGLERASAIDTVNAGRPVQIAQQLTQVMLADPAIICVELSEPTGRLIAEMPKGISCRTEHHDTSLTLPVYFPEKVDLTVRLSLAEIEATKDNQNTLSALILCAGLMIALITNWITFRLIIGKPLHEMIGQIDAARKKAEANAVCDALTGLGNRQHLRLIIEDRLLSMKRGGAAFAILQFDLDYFKDINDSLGHGAGDAMLCHVADILRNAVRPEDFVARTGGDEFVVVTYDEVETDNLSALAERLIQRIAKPLQYEAHSCSVATSIGICQVMLGDVLEGATCEHVLTNGDFALTQAKASGRGKYVFFEEGLRAEVEANKFLAADFERGVRCKEIECFYQPQYDVASGKVVSAEALVRWRHPHLGVLNPNEFLPLADKLSLTPEVDETILKIAVEDLKRWDELGLGIDTVSVNISASRLADPDLIEELIAMDLPCERLTFEILETAFVDSLTDQLRWNLDGIREMGIEVEIDDFGTGKASVLGVIEIAPKRIKVAREIMASLVNGEEGKSFVRAVAAIGHSLGVGMVAEGVEEETHCQIAAELGFDRLQGYHVAYPMQADEFEAWMRSSGFSLDASAQPVSSPASRVWGSTP